MGVCQPFRFAKVLTCTTHAYKSYPAAWDEPLVGSFACSFVLCTKKLEVDCVGAELDPFEEAIFFEGVSVSGVDSAFLLVVESAIKYLRKQEAVLL